MALHTSRNTSGPRLVVLGAELASKLATSQKRKVGVWLLGCAGMVYGAVAIGGVTRCIIHLQTVVCSFSMIFFVRGSVR